MKTLKFKEEGKAIFEQGSSPECFSAPHLKLLLSWFGVHKEEIRLKNQNYLHWNYILEGETPPTVYKR